MDLKTIYELGDRMKYGENRAFRRGRIEGIIIGIVVMTMIFIIFLK